MLKLRNTIISNTSRKGYHSPNQKNVGFPKHPTPKTRPKTDESSTLTFRFWEYLVPGTNRGLGHMHLLVSENVFRDIHNNCKH